MNVNTSNYWSASSASSHGMSGLVSGLDTEKMVEQMLMGTQKKIDAQKGLQQTTNWRQEMYRDIITSINNFRNKYFNTSFDATSSMNFASEAFFNTMKASLTSGSGVRVISADSSALTGDMKVKVDQLASAAKVEGAANAVSTNTITGDVLNNKDIEKAFSKTITMTVDGKAIDVDLSKATTDQEMVDAINKALEGYEGITAKLDSGNIIFNVDSSSEHKLTKIASSELGGRMTGLKDLTMEQDGSGNTVFRGKMKTDVNAAFSFDVALDGMQKNIHLDNIDKYRQPDGRITLDSVSKAINEKLGRAFGNGVLETKVVDGALQFKFGDSYDSSGHSFRLTGVDLNVFGIEPGSFSHVSTSTKLGDLEGVSGSTFEFEINGEKFSFDKDTTIGQMMQEINASGAGVKLSYSSLADKFVLESASTGANYSIEVNQTKGNILSVIFGQDESGKDIVGAGKYAASDKLTANKITGDKLTQNVSEVSIEFSLNGKDFTFTMPKKDEGSYTAAEFEQEFNDFLELQSDGNVSYKDGVLEIKSGYEVSIKSQDIRGVAASEDEAAPKIDLKLEGKNNEVTAETKVEDIANLSQEDIRVLKAEGKNTLGDLVRPEGSDAEMDIEFKDGKLIVNAAGAAKLADLMKGAEFGDGKLEGDVVKGTDAIVTINGVKTTRSSNTFTIDGITMELTGVHKDGEEAVIGTTRDIDSIIEGFESFVKDYNEMLDKLYGYTDAKAEFRKYPPLTEAQKKEMSDREIELWEEKAKTGLLRKDADVEHFLSEMRTAMYERPNGCKFALYDIGIETGEYTSKGKLTLDKTKLRNALAEDPGSVEQLFLDATEGLSDKLVKAMSDAANTSSGSPGTLVKLAGVKGMGTEENNSLSKQLKEIKERISDLERKYEKEKQRYWNQFNKMEQIMANFNAQSGMIQSQFMGMMGY